MGQVNSVTYLFQPRGFSLSYLSLSLSNSLPHHFHLAWLSVEIVCIEFFGEVKVYLVIMLCHFIYETPSGGVGIYIIERERYNYL